MVEGGKYVLSKVHAGACNAEVLIADLLLSIPQTQVGVQTILIVGYTSHHGLVVCSDGMVQQQEKQPC